ncbi:hypothetical protein AMB3_1191 [plant metagenome]
MSLLRSRPAGLLALFTLAVATWFAPAGATGAPAPTGTTPPVARTYYESLDMSSPQASATRFVQAWVAQDFMAVHLLLSPQGEWDASRAIDDYTPQRLVPGFDESDHKVSPVYQRPAQGAEASHDDAAPISEVDFDPTRRFDALMLGAAQRGKLPFVLTSETLVEVGKADDTQATVTLKTPKAETLTMSLLRQPSGRWKVDQVRWPGASIAAHPWDGESGQAQGASSLKPAAAPAGTPRTFYDALDMSSPDTTVQAFIHAWSHGDYFASYHLLSPGAEWDAMAAIGALRMEQLIPGFTLNDLDLSPLAKKTERSREDIARGVAPTNEYNFDNARQFDTLLVGAAVLKKLPFAITAATQAEPAKVDGNRATTVLRTPDAPDLSVALVKLPSDRWKVERIRWAGSSDRLRPWGATASR